MGNIYSFHKITRIRKYQRIVLLILILFGIRNVIYAQGSLLEKTITLEKQTSTIEEILDDIEEAGNCSFAYANCFPIDLEIQLEADTKSVKEFLDEIFENLSIEYKVRFNKRINIIGRDLNKPTLCQRARGTVEDVETKNPLAGAQILFENENNKLYTTSDSNGKYTLGNIPLGRYDIKVSFLGFEEKLIPNVLFSSTKEVYEEVSLSEKPFQLGEVTKEPGFRKCDPKNEAAIVSARSFSIEETRRYPASINDPSRMALAFPGTMFDEDASNELVIRGNSPNGILWRLEGIEIPPPNHFAISKSSSGAVSILSANLMGRSDFLTGAFPAEFGNALSGIFDLSLRSGNNEKREYSFQIGLIGTDLAAEGPFTKNYSGSYLINYRYSTLDLLTNAGLKIAGYEAFPKFEDFSCKFNFPTKRFGTFSIWRIGGYGRVEDRADSTSLDPPERKKIYYRSRMNAAGITHLLRPGSNSYVKSVISYSEISTRNKRSSLDDMDFLILDDYEDHSVNSWKSSMLLKYKFNPRFSAKLGGVFSYFMYDFYEFDYKKNRKEQDSKGSTQLLQTFLQNKYNLSERVLLTGGLHFIYFWLNKDWSIEPRLGLKWSISQKQSLSLGLGKHSRHELFPAYFLQIFQPDSSHATPNTNLELTKSYHTVISYDRDIGNNTHVKVDIYYQYFYDIPVRNIPPYSMAPYNGSFMPDSLFSRGTARNYGIELTIERYFADGYYFMSGTSLFSSKINPGNDTLYSSKYNRRFIQNLVGGKEFKIGKHKQDLCGINAKIIWAGGNRGNKDPYNKEDIDNVQDRYGVQYGNYFRIDLGVNYRKNQLRVSHILSIDIQNITNRKNPLNLNRTHTGTLPMISYKIEF